MAEKHVITALEKKRAELSGDLIKLDKQRRSIRNRIENVDQTLKMFGYEKNPSLIKPVTRYVRMFERNELKLIVTDYIRANGDASNKKIALHAMVQKGWDCDDEVLLSRVIESVKPTKRNVLAQLEDFHSR